MMVLLVILTFTLSLLTPLIAKLNRNQIGVILAALPLAIFIFFAGLYSPISTGEVFRELYNWIPTLGIDFTFYLDGLSFIFTLIISFVGVIVFLYANSYLKNDSSIVRFYVSLLIFMGSMLGLVLSDNFYVAFIFWELTSISSYLLIGHYHEKEASRFSALQALLVTASGGLALLAGFIILESISGVNSFSALPALSDQIISHPLYTTALILILAGAFTKSAQFPFHFWLPNAMEAPTPVSAYLHSATMVKAGVYMLARLNPSLGNTEIWQYALLFFGSATMILGAIYTFRQTDLKRILAYSTVSVLGTLVMLLGIGTDLAIKAFVIYLIAHSLYKGALFLVAGIIDHETGTRDATKLGGLFALMPFTAISAFLAGLSNIGIVPLIGFIGKETVYSAAIEFNKFGYLFILLAIVTNIFIIVATIRTGFQPFLGKKRKTPQHAHEPPFYMLLGPCLLSFAGLPMGIFASRIIGNLINYSELGIISTKISIPVKLWHGLNEIFWLSVITVLLGLALYVIKKRFTSFLEKNNLPDQFSSSFWYGKSIGFLLYIARWQTLILQNGRLRYYILFIILATLGFIFPLFFSHSVFDRLLISFEFHFSEILICIMIIVATIFTIIAPSRLMAVAGLGVVGIGVTLIFLLLGAPDLALAQFAIETLTVILFVLVLYKLPKFIPQTNLSVRVKDFIIAIAAGFMMTLIVLLTASENMVSDLKRYFSETSLTEGFGRNIVNVILVDFRAIDTLGEITVLGIAAISIYALLKLRIKKDDDK